MARPTYWLRSLASFVDGTTTAQTSTRLGIFAPGETLTRVRFSYFLSSYEDTNPLLNDDVVIAVAIEVSPFADVPRNFGPASSPAEDWVWWEGEVQGPGIYAQQPDGTGYFQESRGPMEREHRDCKAQRKNTGEDYWSIWLKTESTIAPTQGKHYLGYAASCLILEAP